MRGGQPQALGKVSPILRSRHESRHDQAMLCPIPNRESQVQQSLFGHHRPRKLRRHHRPSHWTVIACENDPHLLDQAGSRGRSMSPTQKRVLSPL